MASAQAQEKLTEEGSAVAGDPPFPRFKQSLSYQAQLFARLTQNDFMTRIVDTGIAPAQAYVLGELWLNEPQSQVEIARRLDIGKATIGQTLTRLERAGLVRRRRVETDRRVIMVHLTEKGRALREPIRIATVEQDEVLKARIGEEWMAELATALARINVLLGDLGDQGTD